MRESMDVLFTVTGGQGFAGAALSLKLLDSVIYVTFFNFADVAVLIGWHLTWASYQSRGGRDGAGAVRYTNSYSILFIY
jgi:hypothetical protein